MKLVAGAILILAGAILVSAAMLGVDIRNTGAAPYTESRLGYIVGPVVALLGLGLMAMGFWSDRSDRDGPGN